MDGQTVRAGEMGHRVAFSTNGNVHLRNRRYPSKGEKRVPWTIPTTIL